ncbi:phage tail protein [Rouxiella sp. S1S-2]|uniref:phage tail protein n=1 Tax=Rouxiella sp. S1S-2 TaxID=2653856 RepID=UPI0012641A16|nr:phage tail protein [Rouxiella sp. S1S-2]KAB7898046.1 phage tail protein [Rouxiella sp. S1S-2]
MAEKRFMSKLTAVGEEKISQATISGSPAGFAFMAVGDGGGRVPVLDPTPVGLVNEVYRSALNSLTLVDKSRNIIQAEIIIPSQAGGFTLREAALFDDAGVCLAVASIPETYKPLLAEGAGRHQVIRIWLAVSSAASVQLNADPSVIVATAAELKKAQDAAQDYTDGVAGTLTETLKTALADAMKTAIRDVWEDDNPVGTVRLFQQKIDPNVKWPWSTWRYLGENKTLRLGKQDGSDVLTTGGADSIQLGKDNLPNVQIDVAGTAADSDLGTKTTKPAGRHGHPGKYAESNTSIDGGGSSRRSWAIDYAANEGGLIQEAPEHEHDVYIGPHGHVVNGKTSALGNGSNIDITNSFIKLMGWYRTA